MIDGWRGHWYELCSTPDYGSRVSDSEIFRGGFPSVVETGFNRVCTGYTRLEMDVSKRYIPQSVRTNRVTFEARYADVLHHMPPDRAVLALHGRPAAVEIVDGLNLPVGYLHSQLLVAHANAFVGGKTSLRNTLTACDTRTRRLIEAQTSFTMVLCCILYGE